MSEGYTPGPWHVDPDRADGFSPWVRARDGDENYFIAGMADLGGDEIANARLIAAEPDLLAALKEAVADLETSLKFRGGDGWECTEDELLGNARAAIAKATQP